MDESKKNGRLMALSAVFGVIIAGITLCYVVFDHIDSPPMKSPQPLYLKNYSYYSPIPISIYNEFPSYGLGLVTFTIQNLGSDIIDVTASSEINGYTDNAMDSKQISPHGIANFSLYPTFNPGVIDSLTEVKTANIHNKITCKVIGYGDANEETLFEETKPVQILAKDTIIWGDNKELSPFVAEWVTPHASEIDELIRTAQKYNSQGIMGDKIDTQEDRKTQVKAVYEALQNNYDIKYINSVISFGTGDSFSQKIKLPSETIKLKSANCIDSTVLFASALESIGMDPYIVLIPGHAFLLWSNGNNKAEGELETTMVGYNYSFDDAYQAGLNEYDKEKNNGDINKGISVIVSIKDARKHGTMPMQ